VIGWVNNLWPQSQETFLKAHFSNVRFVQDRNERGNALKGATTKQLINDKDAS